MVKSVHSATGLPFWTAIAGGRSEAAGLPPGVTTPSDRELNSPPLEPAK